MTLNKKSSKFLLPNTTPPVLKGLYMGMGIEIINGLSKISLDFLNTFHQALMEPGPARAKISV